MNIIEYLNRETRKNGNSNNKTEEKRTYSYLKFEDGLKKIIRFLPTSYDNNESWIKGYTSHFIPGFEGGKYITCKTDADSEKTDCPICAKYFEDREKYPHLRPSKKYLAYAYDVALEKDYKTKPESVFYIVTLNSSLLETIREFIIDPEFGDLADPVNGWDFKLVTKREGRKWIFPGSLPVKKRKVNPDLIEYYKNNVPDIDIVLIKKTSNLSYLNQVLEKYLASKEYNNHNEYVQEQTLEDRDDLLQKLDSVISEI